MLSCSTSWEEVHRLTTLPSEQFVYTCELEHSSCPAQILNDSTGKVQRLTTYLYEVFTPSTDFHVMEVTAVVLGHTVRVGAAFTSDVVEVGYLHVWPFVYAIGGLLCDKLLTLSGGLRFESKPAYAW